MTFALTLKVDVVQAMNDIEVMSCCTGGMVGEFNGIAVQVEGALNEAIQG